MNRYITVIENQSVADAKLSNRLGFIRSRPKYMIDSRLSNRYIENTEINASIKENPIWCFTVLFMLFRTGKRTSKNPKDATVMFKLSTMFSVVMAGLVGAIMPMPLDSCGPK